MGERARTFNIVAVGTLVIGSLFLGLLILQQPESLERRAASIVILCVLTVGALGLNRRGWTRLASWSLIVGLILLVTERAWVLGGVGAPVTPLYVLFVMMAGLLLGWRAGAVAAGICLAGAALLVVAEEAGRLSGFEPALPPRTTLLYIAMFMGLTLLLQSLIARTLRDSLERAEAELSERRRVVVDLHERVKELGLLHSAAQLFQQTRLSEHEMLQQLVGLAPPSWKHPECCQARISYGDIEVSTPGWRDAPWKQCLEFSSAGRVGRFEVVYTEARPAADEGPFLKEERAVLESLSEMLVTHLELRQHQQGLENLVATRTAELRAAKDTAESASRAKGAFLAHMSHEIRTPMNAILGYAQLLQVDGVLDDSQKRKLEVIRTSGDHLLGLINDVLEMSRIEAGRTALAQQPFDLHGLLAHVRSMFAEQAAARGLALDFETDDALARALRGDPGKVRQVLINLIGNAVKLTDRGRISVRAASRETDPERCLVTIAVEDTGPGIAFEDQDRIFSPFSQAETGVSRGGTGLGLAISRNFARLMGGSLTVRSAPGHGSTFTFAFEAPRVPEAQLQERDVRVGTRRLDPAEKRRKVLVVDDVPASRDLLQEELTRAGFETRAAASGEDALAQHDAWSPDLVLMDLHMRGLGGLEAVRRLRAAGSQAVIGITTASTDQAIEATAREAGAGGVLRKPSLEGDVLDFVGRLMKVRFHDVAPALTSAVPRPPLEPLLAGVPSELIDSLRDAARQARASRLTELADRVTAHSAAAAEAIRALTHDFRYSDLLAALEGRGAHER